MSISSVNFAFLSCYDETLVEFAGAAEANVLIDPNTSLVKMRQFAEFLAKHVSARAGLSLELEDFKCVVQALRTKRIIPRVIAEQFDLLRLRGNAAVHEALRDPNVAYQALITAYTLAVWFHRTVIGNKEFAPGPFRPPPSPARIEQALRDELESARSEVAGFKAKVAEAEGQIVELADARNRLEAEISAQYNTVLEHYKAALQTDQLESGQKIAMLQQRLARLSADVAVHSDQIATFIDRTSAAAYRLGLVGDDAKYLPIAQLRIKGPRLSTCHNVPTLIVQSSKGGFVSVNCTNCNRSDSLRHGEFFGLDVWVSCAKCRTRMEPTIVQSNYGFVCPKCDWRCLLASLVPHYSEIQ